MRSGWIAPAATLAVHIAVVVGTSPEEQVGWIYAIPHVARMAHAQSVWNPAAIERISHSMSVLIKPFRVALLAELARPNPASREGNTLDGSFKLFEVHQNYLRWTAHPEG